MSYCVKCTSEKNLSVKYYTKVSREPRYYCNQCRLDEKYRNPPKSKKKPDFTTENWNEMFKETYEKLNRRPDAVLIRQG